jgi:dihydrofolate reductase
MRQLRYGVAMSLDGYIAGPNGEADWIVMDPELDFGAYFSRFDTLLMGRGSFEAMRAMGGGDGNWEGMQSVVASTTMRPSDHPSLTIVNDAASFIKEQKRMEGKDIWLFGGGRLFQSLLDAGLVDGIDVGVIPVLLGGGVPFLATPAKRAMLKLTEQRLYKASGTVSLQYEVVRSRRAKS